MEENPHRQRPIALRRQTLSTPLARHLTNVVRACLMSLDWVDLLQLPMDGTILVRRLDKRSTPVFEDIMVVRATDEFWQTDPPLLADFEILASFRYALNDLRSADEAEEEELAKDSTRLPRYVTMSRDAMVEFLTNYASYLIEDFAKEH